MNSEAINSPAHEWVPPYFNFHILPALLKRPGMTFEELEDHLGWHPRTLERVLQDLIDDHLITCTPPADEGATATYALDMGGVFEWLDRLWPRLPGESPIGWSCKDC